MRWAFAEGYDDLAAFAAAHDIDGDFGARIEVADDLPEVAIGFDGLQRFLVDADDDVPCFDAGVGGGLAGFDAADDHAAAVVDFESLGLGGGEFLHVDAEEAARDFTLGEEQVGDALGGVGGDGEADALVAPGVAGDHGVDADD